MQAYSARDVKQGVRAMSAQTPPAAQITDLGWFRELKALVPGPSKEVVVLEPDLLEQSLKWAAGEFAAEYPDAAPAQDKDPPG